MNSTRLIIRIALINEQEDVLVLRRSRTDVWRPGEVDFPGGTHELGEDILQTILRETSEETGVVLNVSDISVLHVATEDPKDNGAVVFRVLCAAKALDARITLSDEHDQYEWLSVPEAVAAFAPDRTWGASLAFAVSNNLLP